MTITYVDLFGLKVTGPFYFPANLCVPFVSIVKFQSIVSVEFAGYSCTFYE